VTLSTTASEAGAVEEAEVEAPAVVAGAGAFAEAALSFLSAVVDADVGDGVVAVDEAGCCLYGDWYVEVAATAFGEESFEAIRGAGSNG